jgi:hypothetical protein
MKSYAKFSPCFALTSLFSLAALLTATSTALSEPCLTCKTGVSARGTALSLRDITQRDIRCISDLR